MSNHSRNLLNLYSHRVQAYHHVAARVLSGACILAEVSGNYANSSPIFHDPYQHASSHLLCKTWQEGKHILQMPVYSLILSQAPDCCHWQELRRSCQRTRQSSTKGTVFLLEAHHQLRPIWRQSRNPERRHCSPRRYRARVLMRGEPDSLLSRTIAKWNLALSLARMVVISPSKMRTRM